jgi:hypothetical protein
MTMLPPKIETRAQTVVRTHMPYTLDGGLAHRARIGLAALAGPLVIHAVQDVVHPLARLARPIEPGPSRVVFITWDVSRARVDALMRELAE